MITIRCIICSDAHGSPHLITNVLKHSRYDKNTDRLVFCGDLVDIGYSALECIDILQRNNAELLIGNHDAAIILNKQIWPQNMINYEEQEKIIKIQNEFKMAAVHDGVLITHAGLSDVYFSRQNDVGLIKETLNRTPLVNLWSGDNILWFRPGEGVNPHPEIVQVVGHTPPSWCRPIKDFYMIDPYCKVGFDSGRFRYAVIKDGVVEIFDSNEKRDLYSECYEWKGG
ncbi:MAG: metallophosphoesterase [Proteobacteria bacterium]|nr:metallophosphoesterase [Pseudomonadota bacterium]